MLVIVLFIFTGMFNQGSPLGTCKEYIIYNQDPGERQSQDSVWNDTARNAVDRAYVQRMV